MTTLTVLKFGNVDDAEKAVETVEDLQKQELIKVVDAATVSWPHGSKKPMTKQAIDLPCMGALDGSFWGMLFGMLFFMPLIGALLGSAFGAINGMFADFGIDDGFIEETKGKITEGTSALFLMSTDEVEDRVADSLKDMNPEVLATNLSGDEEEKLKAMFKH